MKEKFLNVRQISIKFLVLLKELGLYSNRFVFHLKYSFVKKEIIWFQIYSNHETKHQK